MRDESDLFDRVTFPILDMIVSRAAIHTVPLFTQAIFLIPSKYIYLCHLYVIVPSLDTRFVYILYTAICITVARQSDQWLLEGRV